MDCESSTSDYFGQYSLSVWPNGIEKRKRIISMLLLHCFTIKSLPDCLSNYKNIPILLLFFTYYYLCLCFTFNVLLLFHSYYVSFSLLFFFFFFFFFEFYFDEKLLSWCFRSHPDPDKVQAADFEEKGHEGEIFSSTQYLAGRS